MPYIYVQNACCEEVEPSFMLSVMLIFGYKGKKKTRKKELETEKQKADFVASYDWNRMTAQDEKVWNEIFKVLAE